MYNIYTIQYSIYNIQYNIQSADGALLCRAACNEPMRRFSAAKLCRGVGLPSRLACCWADGMISPCAGRRGWLSLVRVFIQCIQNI